jgi:capsular exopolysaccharide synthesis family protein
MAPAAEQPNPDAPQQRVAAYLRAVRRRLPLIIGLTAIVTAVAVGLSLSSTKKYEGESKIVLTRDDPINQFLDPGVTQGSTDPERDINTDVELIKLESVAERVRDRVDLDMSSKDLLEDVSADVESNSNIVVITVLNEDPETAAALATGFAEEYAAFRRDTARESLSDAGELARTQLESLSDIERSSPEGRELQATLRQIEIAAAAQSGGVEVVRRASVPTDAATPRPLLTGILALILGGGLALGVALLFEFLDRRIKDDEDIEALFGLPVLASIPRPRRRGDVVPGEDHSQYEGYSAFATNLRFFELGPDLEAIMITSPGPAEGKTSVTLGTARALTALDLRVIAIEADLRRPSFSRYGLARGGGLSTVLAGVTSLEQALVEVDAGTMQRVTDGTGAHERTFWVLPAGPMPPNPQALLARPAMTHILEEARAMADVVLVDLPPIGAVNDPVTVANLVDGVVVVARLNTTTRDAARRALRVLRNTDAELLGVVITDTPAPSQGYYYGPAGARPQARATPGRAG